MAKLFISLHLHPSTATPVAKIWEKIWKVSNPSACPVISGLLVNNQLITSQIDVASTLAGAFADSTNHYPPEFLTRKTRLEQMPLCFSSRNKEIYNLPFSRADLDNTLYEWTARLVQIRYIGWYVTYRMQVTCRMPMLSRRLLTTLNRICREGDCPRKWK